jgi:hypothetical protein
MYALLRMPGYASNKIFEAEDSDICEEGWAFAAIKHNAVVITIANLSTTVMAQSNVRVVAR